MPSDSLLWQVMEEAMESGDHLGSCFGRLFQVVLNDGLVLVILQVLMDSSSHQPWPVRKDHGSSNSSKSGWPWISQSWFNIIFDPGRQPQI